MPRLKPSEIRELEKCEPGIINHVPAQTTLSKQVLRSRECEDIYDSGFAGFYRESFLNDDGRNSVMPAKAIWPWPVPDGMEFNEYWDESDFQDCYPMSSVKPEPKNTGNQEFKQFLYPEWEYEMEIKHLIAMSDANQTLTALRQMEAENAQFDREWQGESLDIAFYQNV